MDIDTVKKNKDPRTGKFSSYQVTIKNSDIQYCVPLNEENSDYQQIQEWAKIDGNTIQEAD